MSPAPLLPPTSPRFLSPVSYWEQLEKLDKTTQVHTHTHLFEGNRRALWLRIWGAKICKDCKASIWQFFSFKAYFISKHGGWKSQKMGWTFGNFITGKKTQIWAQDLPGKGHGTYTKPLVGTLKSYTLAVITRDSPDFTRVETQLQAISIPSLIKVISPYLSNFQQQEKIFSEGRYHYPESQITTIIISNTHINSQTFKQNS